MSNEGGRVLPDVLAELVVLSAESFDVAELLHLATDRACEVLDSDGSVVLLSRDGTSLEDAGSSGSIGDINDVLTVDAAPCKAAMWSAQPVRYVAGVDAPTYPDYAPLADARGICRVLSVPLRRRAGAFGSLSTVRLTPRDYTDDEVEAAVQLADVVAAVVVREESMRAALEIRGQLEHALQARVVIEQAKGMIAAELRVTIDEALDCLRGYARGRHLRLADVAADIVGRELPTSALSL